MENCTQLNQSMEINKPKENSNRWHFVKCQNHFSKYEFVAYESFMFQTIA